MQEFNNYYFIKLLIHAFVGFRSDFLEYIGL